MKIKYIIALLLVSCALGQVSNNHPDSPQQRAISMPAFNPNFAAAPAPTGLWANVVGGQIMLGGTLKTIPDARISVKANATNYVYLDLVTATINSNTTGFLSITDAYYPIAIDVTNATFITTQIDVRPDVFGTGQGGGGGSSVALYTNGVFNSNQTTLNLAQTSGIGIANVGGTTTFTNLGVLGVTGSSPITATGTSTINVGMSTACVLQVWEWSGSSWGCTPVGGGLGAQYQTAVYTAANTLGGIGPGIFGQVLASQGVAALPAYSSAGIAGRTVSAGGTDSILCDSGTTTQDRIKKVYLNTGGAITETVPDPGTTGCGNNFSFGLLVGVGTTATVTHSSTATFTVFNGSSVTTGTSVTLIGGQLAKFNSPDNVNWWVEVPGGLGGSGTVNFMAKWCATSGLCNSQITDDGTHSPVSPSGFDLGTVGALSNQIANNATTATVVNTLACDDGTGKVLICSHTTSTTNQPVGTVTNGAGTTGNATVAYIGFITVCFDNQTTARDYAIESTTNDGCLHDTGSTTLTAGQPNYFVWTANTGALTNGVYRLLTADDFTNASCANCVTAAATLTNHAVVLGSGSKATHALASLGTTTTVLHGNASGDPSYAAVAGADMTNNTVTATQLAAQYSKGSCTEVWGGSGTAFALTAGDDSVSNNSCYNDSGVTRTITAVKCRSDNGSNTTTVNPTFGAAGTGTTILSGALTCGNSYAYSSTGTVSNASWTTGTGITPAMSGTLTGTSISMQISYTY